MEKSQKVLNEKETKQAIVNKRRKENRATRLELMQQHKKKVAARLGCKARRAKDPIAQAHDLDVKRSTNNAIEMLRK